MRKLLLLAGLSAATLLTACAVPDQGYYDANGNYIPAPNATTEVERRRAPDPGKSDRAYYGRDYRGEYDRDYRYTRRGYYDYNGYFVTLGQRTGVPADMFPPRGMCRVWLPQRMPEEQPAIESCDGISYRVPVGAYVVYGG